MAFEILKPEWGASRPIRGVLFDMDGLVLDTEKLYSRFWMEACRFYGFPMTREQSLRMRGLGGKAGTEMLHSFFGPGADYPEIRAKRIELMDAFIAENGVEAKPGIFELLDYLRANDIATAITSSSPMDRICQHLGSLGLLDRFDRICSGHEVPRGKPEPDIYLRGAEVLGLKPEECLALEDAHAGLLSAYRAGCLPVMIPDLDAPNGETIPLLYAKADSLADVVDLMNERTREVCR